MVKVFFSFFLISIFIQSLSGIAAAGENILKKDIPTTIPNDVRKHIENLYSEDYVTRTTASQELGKMGARAVPAIPYLLKVLRGDDAVLAVANIGEPAVDPLLKILNEEEWEYQIDAIIILGLIGEKRAVEPLIGFLKDKDCGFRMKAALSLGRIKDPKAVEPLIFALKYDKVEQVRIDAAEALGNIKDIRAIEHLIAVMGSLGGKRSNLEYPVIKSLQEITGENYGKDILSWQRWWKQNREKLEPDNQSIQRMRNTPR